MKALETTTVKKNKTMRVTTAVAVATAIRKTAKATTLSRTVRRRQESRIHNNKWVEPSGYDQIASRQ